MKTIDLFCSSPASIAICSSTDQRTMVRHGPRPIIHRHHHRLDDSRQIRPLVPWSSQPLPLIDPQPHYQKSGKNTSNKSELRRKSSSTDILHQQSTLSGSSRYLLSDTSLSKLMLSNGDETVSSLIPSQCLKGKNLSSNHDYHASKYSSTGSNYGLALMSSSTRTSEPPVLRSSSTRPRPRNQVVELRVSIHCKGCEGRVRKHISRMEGVTWFSIDLATKKVTVVGDVTPLGVLTSVSRVKNAEFWPSPTSSSPSSSSSSPMTGLNY